MKSPRDPPSVELVQVEREFAGQRMDNWLMRHLKGVPKSRIYRVLRRGEVRVNKRRVKPDYRVQPGDVVRVPPIRVPTKQTGSPPPEQAALSLLSRILFEDEGILVVNKPAGMAVHGGSGLDWGLIDALRLARPELKRLELVHRLDRETSGCLLLAKSALALRALHQDLREGQVDKAYLALAKGPWDLGRRRVSVPLKRSVLRGGERLVEVDAEGKQAVTRFEPTTLFPGAALLTVGIETGRTHQIRVHAAHLGHPLAGDRRYGDRRFNRNMRALGIRRLFLHAHQLGWRLGGRFFDVSAPLEPDLAAALTILEAQHEASH
jgi:23S rRNA pseudouridine955/2504/2580 synthase